MLNQISLDREFSKDARIILHLADSEARFLNDQELCEHHLLLAIAAHARGVTRTMLDRLNITHDGLIKLLTEIQSPEIPRKESENASQDHKREGKEVADEAKSPDKVQRTKR